jgi:dephospho-CoA kinase
LVIRHLSFVIRHLSFVICRIVDVDKGPDSPRICVIGTSGSGKTTLARLLADWLGIRFVCNDSLIWQPDWVPTPKPEFYRLAEEATRVGPWTFDGNLGNDPADAMILRRATAVVWLDYPWHVVMRQVTLRTVRRVARGERLFSGNVETFRQSSLSRDSVILWAAQSHGRLRRRYQSLFERLGNNSPVRLVRLRSTNETGRWLKTVVGHGSIQATAR